MYVWKDISFSFYKCDYSNLSLYLIYFDISISFFSSFFFPLLLSFTNRNAFYLKIDFHLEEKEEENIFFHLCRDELSYLLRVRKLKKAQKIELELLVVDFPSLFFFLLRVFPSFQSKGKMKMNLKKEGISKYIITLFQMDLRFFFSLNVNLQKIVIHSSQKIFGKF